jgi:UDPglucose--hexose-1-phosphate uridylyltransferase
LKLDARRFSNDEGGKGLLVAEGEAVSPGHCFSPRRSHSAKMSVEEIRAAVDVWSERTSNWRAGRVGYVQIFENRGAMMGRANPHPHGQIWASRSVPNESSRSLADRYHWAGKNEVLLCAYLRWKRRWESD